MAEFRASALFCDLTRREDSGKLLIVGAYLGDMVVPAGQPAGIHLVVFIHGPITRPIPKLAASIELDGQPFLGFETPAEELVAGPTRLPPDMLAAAKAAEDAGLGAALGCGQTTVGILLPPSTADQVLTVHADLGDGPKLVSAMLVRRSAPG